MWRGSVRRKALLAVFAVSCAQKEPAEPPVTDPTTDPSTTTPTVLEDSGTWVPADTAGTVTDLVPDATVRIVEEGVWVLDPPGGPWTSLTGTLSVKEYPDGDIPSDTAVPEMDTSLPPPCELEFAVAGTVVPAPACPNCDVVFDMTWSLTAGDPYLCHDPDLPGQGAVWRLGWSSAEETIKFDYYGSGVWVDWFYAENQGDVLRVSYDTTKAIAVEEEE